MPAYIVYPYFAAVLFLLYRRVKNGIGFQKYEKHALLGKILLFSVAAIFSVIMSITRPDPLFGAAAGILAGLGLVYVATKDVQFEIRKDGLYYRTTIWIELTVLLLFFARFIFRFYALYSSLGHLQSIAALQNIIHNTNDPYTAGAVMVLCTYYTGYYIVVIKKGSKRI